MRTKKELVKIYNEFFGSNEGSSIKLNKEERVSRAIFLSQLSSAISMACIGYAEKPAFLALPLGIFGLIPIELLTLGRSQKNCDFSDLLNSSLLASVCIGMLLYTRHDNLTIGLTGLALVGSLLNVVREAMSTER